MRSITVLLIATGLMLLCGSYDKEPDNRDPVLQQRVKGKLLYSSCATIAVQVLDRNIGSSWTNCHDQQTYQQVIEVNIVNEDIPSLKTGQEFLFDIVDRTNYAHCFMNDCGPSEHFSIRITSE